MIGHSIEHSGIVHESAREHSYLVTRCKSRPHIHSDKALIVLALLQRGHHAFGHRSRDVANADEARHTKGRLDGSPTLRCDIDRNKHVARKQRLANEVNLSRMPTTLEVAREIDVKTLTLQ